MPGNGLSQKVQGLVECALADCGGLFWENISDSQIQALLRDMTRKYFVSRGKNLHGCHRCRTATFTGRNSRSPGS